MKSTGVHSQSVPHVVEVSALSRSTVRTGRGNFAAGNRKSPTPACFPACILIASGSSCRACSISFLTGQHIGRSESWASRLRQSVVRPPMVMTPEPLLLVKSRPKSCGIVPAAGRHLRAIIAVSSVTLALRRVPGSTGSSGELRRSPPSDLWWPRVAFGELRTAWLRPAAFVVREGDRLAPQASSSSSPSCGTLRIRHHPAWRAFRPGARISADS